MTLKEKAIKIIQGAMGDDLERATNAFKYHTPSMMLEEYGNSGKSCSEILEGYRKNREEIIAVLDWIKTKEIL